MFYIHKQIILTFLNQGLGRSSSKGGILVNLEKGNVSTPNYDKSHYMPHILNEKILQIV